MAHRQVPSRCVTSTPDSAPLPSRWPQHPSRGPQLPSGGLSSPLGASAPLRGSHLYECVGEAPGGDGAGLPGRAQGVGGRTQRVGAPPGRRVPLSPSHALRAERSANHMHRSAPGADQCFYGYGYVLKTKRCFLLARVLVFLNWL